MVTTLFIVYLGLIHRNRKDKKFILVNETSKLNFVMFSASPGHIHIASYRIIEYGIRLKTPSSKDK